MKSIVKGVEMPRRPPTVEVKYPFATMAVGDMFFLKGREENNFASYAWRMGKSLKRKFNTKLCWMRDKGEGQLVVCEPTDDGAMQGIGVWRIK